MSEHAAGKIRLQKFLSEAGVAARRVAEDLVLEGRVQVNGQVVDGLPAFVDPEEDDVRVDGDRVRAVPKVYYLIDKPKGTVVSNYDPAGRKKVGDLLTGVEARVFPIGRMEVDADGLLLLTNDGELAEKLTHPKYGVEKIFRVEVKGEVRPDDLVRIRKGMWFSEGRTSSTHINVTYSARDMTVMEISMRESRHRAIPRMLARLGYKIRKLTCIRIGKLTTKGMQSGQFRPLARDEVKHLYNLAEKSRTAMEAQAAERRPRRASLPPKEAAEQRSRPSREAAEQRPRREDRPGKQGERRPRKAAGIRKGGVSKPEKGRAGGSAGDRRGSRER